MGTACLLEAALASLELIAKPKVTSDKMGIYVTYLKAFTTPRSTGLLGREEQVSAQKETEHFEEDDVPEQQGTAAPWGTGSQVAVMLPAGQGPIPRCASRAGPETAARFSQESQQ